MKPTTKKPQAPEKLTSIQDLIQFTRSIPAKNLIVDSRGPRFLDDSKGCILGQIDNRYPELRYAGKIVGVDAFQLAGVNNGAYNNGASGWDIYSRPEGTPTDGASIKKRLLAFLKTLLKK